MKSKSENKFMIIQAPAMQNFEARKQYVQSMNKSFKNKGMIIQHLKSNEVHINGKKSLEMTFTGTMQGISTKIYEVVLGNSKGTILFCGFAYTQQVKLLMQFKKIAKTLKIK